MLRLKSEASFRSEGNGNGEGNRKHGRLAQRVEQRTENPRIWVRAPGFPPLFSRSKEKRDASREALRFACVAQLEEHLTFNQRAVSSSLTTDTIWAPSLIGNYRGTARGKYGGDLVQIMEDYPRG